MYLLTRCCFNVGRSLAHCYFQKRRRMIKFSCFFVLFFPFFSSQLVFFFSCNSCFDCAPLPFAKEQEEKFYNFGTRKLHRKTVKHWWLTAFVIQQLVNSILLLFLSPSPPPFVFPLFLLTVLRKSSLIFFLFSLVLLKLFALPL